MSDDDLELMRIFCFESVLPVDVLLDEIDTLVIVPFDLTVVLLELFSGIGTSSPLTVRLAVDDSAVLFEAEICRSTVELWDALEVDPGLSVRASSG